MSKKVSVVIPAYNEENYLLDTLKSVEQQAFDHSQMEVIVVNNASTDRTARVYESYQNNSYIESCLLWEPILSPGQARNTGARKARGEVLLFLDADSIMSPYTVQRVWECIEEGFLMGIIKIKALSSDPVGIAFFEVIHWGKKLFNLAAHMGYCQREVFFEVGGFNPEIKHAEDLDFYTRVKKHLKEKGKQWCFLEDAPIWTSVRRMERGPWKMGYLITLFEWWFGGLFRLQRKTYRAYR